MDRDQFDYDDIPAPPWPAYCLESIGEFFLIFSGLEQWLCEYLVDRGHFSERKLRGLSFRSLVKEWKSIEQHTDAVQVKVEATFKKLFELADKRDAIAHAWWRQHNDELRGDFFRRRDGSKLTINGYAEICALVREAKHCEAVLDFWNAPSLDTTE